MQRGLLVVILTLAASSRGLCQTSFWNNAAIPAVTEAGYDTASVTLGLTFYSDVGGSVTGVRFYKGPHNTGPHVGNLWSSTGAKLAEVVFSGETASGWQQAGFSSPVTIAANTPYVISYLAPNGNYAFDDFYPWQNLSAAPLHPSGDAPSVYAYGSAASFPNRTWNLRNYAIDVVFIPSTMVGANTFWTNAAVPAVTEAGYDTASVTLGLTFYSDVGGSVTGVRFYKGPHNTGTHVGDLWSISGAKLAEVVFSGETASGWQQAVFSSPVNIAANTPYVVSYLAPNGNYAFSDFYPWQSLSAAPLHPSIDTPSVYAYGPAAAFPNRTWNSRSYWVDVLFSPSSSSSGSPGIYTISGNVTGVGATLTLSGSGSGLTVTNGLGSYSFSGIANGSYVVAASQPGYFFIPSIAPIVVNGTSVFGVNFNAVALPGVLPGQSPHSVSLSWESSLSPGIWGYYVYRSSVSGGPYSRLHGFPLQALFYVDHSVQAGETYFYVATAVDIGNGESLHSNEAIAKVPSP